eukprot:3941869-Rhodomonas_salina.4
MCVRARKWWWYRGANVMIVRFMFTGGQHAGKTTAMHTMNDFLRAHGVTVVCVHETATEIIQATGPPSSSVEALHTFQAEIARVQAARERAAETAAKQLDEAGSPLVVMLFDRCVFDGKAFVGNVGSWERVLSETGLRLCVGTFREEGVAGFDMVVHMETCAAGGGAALYSEHSAATGTTRLHCARGAVAADRALQEQYEAHANYARIRATGDFAAKLGVVQTCVLGTLRQRGAWCGTEEDQGCISAPV